jgi:hypothetical protein
MIVLSSESFFVAKIFLPFSSFTTVVPFFVVIVQFLPLTYFCPLMLTSVRFPFLSYLNEFLVSFPSALVVCVVKILPF